MGILRTELGHTLKRGIDDASSGRISDGTSALLNDEWCDPACKIVKMINQGTHGHRLFVSRDAALRIFQLVDDTFEDFSHLVADLETRLKLVFEEILAVPRSGKLIDSSFPGLRAAMVHLSEPSRAALFYLVDDTKVVLTSYVDEHYQDDLQGVFVELGLLPR